MKLIYESGDVVKLEDDASAGEFKDCKVILLCPCSFGGIRWKVKDHGLFQQQGH